jgi:HAD superfamily hydrolase (TIGR01509 family)
MAKDGSHPAFLFDLDGTLVDTVYQHVLAWREALERAGIDLAVWRIHRRIGMSGGLLVRALLREIGRPLSNEQAEELKRFHAEAYKRYVPGIRALPGASDLLRTLDDFGVKWAIATSGNIDDAEPALSRLNVRKDAVVITRADIQRAKPDPDTFLAAARKLNAEIENCIVVGDSVWDLLASRRAHTLGVGVLSGGYGEDELLNAGAYRVYADPADLLAHLDEVGVRIE